MPGSITRQFRLNNAQQFKEAFEETSPDYLYLFIGRLQAWPNGDTVPSPSDTITGSSYDPWHSMIAAKKINTNDMTFAVRRYNWTSGTVYNEYDDKDTTYYDSQFYVLTDDNHVYKCLFNNRGAASTVKPTGTSTTTITTVDGYRWKFMYDVSNADVLKFVTPSYIPVKTLLVDDSSSQWDVQSAASNGSIDIIDVTANGSNYLTRANTISGVTNSSVILLDSGSSGTDDVYNGLSLFIASGLGAGQIRAISDYSGVSKTVTLSSGFTISPNTSSEFHIGPTITVTGDGSGALAYANVESGQIKKINMINVGSNYSKASVGITGVSGSGATAVARVSPPGGHGSDPVSELNGYNVMLNVRISGNEGNNFPTNNDFRIIGTLKNPLLANGSIATDSAYDQTTKLTLIGKTGGDFEQDEIVVGPVSGATGRVVSFANTNATGTTGILKVVDVNGDFVNERITGNTSIIAANVTSIQAGELSPYKGDILYTENRVAAIRSADQIEDIKLIIQY